MTKDVIFYLAEAAIYAKKSSFLSFYSFLVKFSKYTGEVTEGNWQSVMTKLNGMKNAIMQVAEFLNGPMFYFIGILFYIERNPQSYP